MVMNIIFLTAFLIVLGRLTVTTCAKRKMHRELCSQLKLNDENLEELDEK